MAEAKTFKQIIDELTVADTLEKVHAVGGEIDNSFDKEKISYPDHERLMALYVFALNAYGEKCCFKRSDIKLEPGHDWICKI